MTFPKAHLARSVSQLNRPTRSSALAFDLQARALTIAVREMYARLKNPPCSVDQPLETFGAAELAKAAAQLTTMRELL